MNKIIVFAMLMAVALAAPTLHLGQPGLAQPGLGGQFGLFPQLGTGSAAGAGTGNAGPGGVSASGVAISSAQNGGFGSSTGTGTAFENFFTGQAGATGTGTGQSFGK